MWPWSRKHEPQATDEAYQAGIAARRQLTEARLLREQVSEVQQAASAAMARNHFGAALTAAMGRNHDA